jgi:hypothetical protein
MLPMMQVESFTTFTVWGSRYLLCRPSDGKLRVILREKAEYMSTQACVWAEPESFTFCRCSCTKARNSLPIGILEKSPTFLRQVLKIVL